jgi:bifunctional N-acetylglucosamine-1-phosphate-uridyltransferase/glucosamine-1-phosphate-acetyltransferase GlmU-like protein
VEATSLIGVRQIKAGGRTVTVELSRNECGTVAARCLIGSGDMPIIDGPTLDEVMAAVEDALEGLLFARARRAA